MAYEVWLENYRIEALNLFICQVFQYFYHLRRTALIQHNDAGHYLKAFAGVVAFVLTVSTASILFIFIVDLTFDLTGQYLLSNY